MGAMSKKLPFSYGATGSRSKGSRGGDFAGKGPKPRQGDEKGRCEDHHECHLQTQTLSIPYPQYRR